MNMTLENTDKNVVIYTPQTIAEKCNSKLLYENTLEYMFGLHCVEYIPVNSTKYPETRFWLFETIEDAKLAFSNIHERWFDKENDKSFKCTETALCGWETGVYDACKKIFIYITGNLIINHLDCHLGTWFSSRIYDSLHVKEKVNRHIKSQSCKAEKRSEPIHKMIMEEW